MGIVFLALIPAYGAAAIGLSLGCSALSAFVIATLIATAVTMAIGARIAWATDANTALDSRA